MKLHKRSSRCGNRAGYWAMVVAMGALSLGGCGGGGGSNNNSQAGSSASVSSQAQVSISGQVSGISGAFVRLDDAQGDALAQVQQTAATGSFSFSGLPAQRVAGAQVTAKGGSDLNLGLDYTGLSLLGLYQGETLNLSALSTLAALAVSVNGETLVGAKSRLSGLLQLPESAFSDAPTSSSAALRTHVQLTRLAEALRTQGGFSQVLALIDRYGRDWSAIAAVLADPAVEDTNTGLNLALAHIHAIEAIDQALLPAATQTEINLSAIRVGITDFVTQGLAYSPLDAQAFAANVNRLAEQLLSANQAQGLPLKRNTYANVLRYSFNQYALSPTSLDAADPVELSALGQDTTIASIASLNAQDHTLALSDSERLGDMVAKRNYYYASDLAPAYRATQLFTQVLDDNYTDEIYGFIAADYAARGMPQQAQVILQSQIFSPYWVAYAMLRVGDAYAKRGDVTTAKTYWDQAGTTLSQYIATKGWQTLDSADASVLQHLSRSYIAQGFTDEAAAVMVPVNQFLDAQAGIYTTAFGRILVAIGGQADAAVDAAVAANLAPAAVSDALAQVEFFSRIVENTGLQTATTSCGDHYMLKAINITSLVSLYTSLEMPDRVRAEIDRFNLLRASHSCTATRTNVYVKNLVTGYGYLNDIDGYLALVESRMSDATSAQKTAAVTAAKGYRALQAAQSGDSATAIDLARESTISATLAALTNSGINESGSSRGLALLLRDTGYPDAIAPILDAAWTLASSTDYAEEQRDSGANYARFGCAKIARLSARLVNPDLGQSRLNQCAALVDSYAQSGNLGAGTEARIYLAEAALQLNAPALANTAALTAINELAGLPLDVRAERIADLMLYGVPAGLLSAGVSFNLLLTQTDELEVHYRALVAAASTQTQLADAMNYANTILSRYGYLIQGLRQSVITLSATGVRSFPELAGQLRQVKDRAYALMQANQAVVAQVTTASKRTSYYNYLIGSASTSSYVARNELFDAATALINDISQSESESKANDYRVALAKEILSFNAFGGADLYLMNQTYVHYASVDTDNDGLADFFDAHASDADISQSIIGLDDDVDNDETPDAMDSTPFYCDSCNLH